YYTFNMFDAQAWYARDVMLGRIALPDAETMAADAAEWIKREEAAQDPNAHIDFQAAYIHDLVAHTDSPRFDIDGMAELFKQWLRDKQEDILGYRDKSHRSTMTGTLAPAHHTPWMQAMDDSVEAFLADPSEVQQEPAEDLRK